MITGLPTNKPLIWRIHRIHDACVKKDIQSKRILNVHLTMSFT